MKLSFKRLKSNAVAPMYQTSGSAGADVSAFINGSITLHPGERALVPTGIALEIPDGYEVQVRARSGLSAKHGVCLANGVGTIDSDYRGEIGVILINLGLKPFLIEPGMRIAQIVVVPCLQVTFEEVVEVSETIRGEGGYGSTGA